MRKLRIDPPLLCHGHSRPVMDLDYSDMTPDGHFLMSASKDCMPMLRCGKLGDWLGTFEGHRGAVWCCKLDENGFRGASGSGDFTAKIWNAVTGNELHSFEHKHVVRACALSKDTKNLLTGGPEKKLRIYDLNRHDASPMVLEGSHDDTIRTLTILNDDRTILSTCHSKGNAWLWDARYGNVAMTLNTRDPITSVELSNDGRYITTATGSTVKFWDANNFSLLKSYNMPCLIESASLHPESNDFFVAGGEDMWVYMYDFHNGDQIDVFRGHHGPIHCVRFAPDGSSFASGSEDGVIRIWQTCKLERQIGKKSNGNGNLSIQ